MVQGILKALGLAALLLFAQAASAAEELKLKDGKAYTHKHSKIAIPAVLGGLERVEGLEYAGPELDVSVEFRSADDAEDLSVYIFRATNGSTAVWFDQAQTAVLKRDVYKSPSVAAAPAGFALPGDPAGRAGIRAVYQPGEGAHFRSTGIAMFRAGDWYVKLRASSRTRDAAALGGWMTEVLGALVVPAKLAGDPAASPVEVCANRLEFPVAAQDAPADLASSLVSAVMGLTIAEAESEPEDGDAVPVVWCRDRTMDGFQAVFRPDAATDCYLLAFGDNGNAIMVAPDAGAALLGITDGNASPPAARFTATLITAQKDVLFVAQDRLPSPERTVSLINGARKTSSYNTWGKDKTVEFNADSAK